MFDDPCGFTQVGESLASFRNFVVAFSIVLHIASPNLLLYADRMMSILFFILCIPTEVGESNSVRILFEASDRALCIASRTKRLYVYDSNLSRPTVVLGSIATTTSRKTSTYNMTSWMNSTKWYRSGRYYLLATGSPSSQILGRPTEPRSGKSGLVK